jgi:hypothetical protein
MVQDHQQPAFEWSGSDHSVGWEGAELGEGTQGASLLLTPHSQRSDAAALRRLVQSNAAAPAGSQHARARPTALTAEAH